MATPEPLQKLFAAIDKNKLKFIENLRKAVAIKSVSAWPHTRPDITTMMKWMGDELKDLGAAIEYVNIDFDPEVYRQDIGAPGLMHGNDKAKTLMARWRYPSLSLHGIQGAFADPGAKTVIPRKVIGKFSIRIVPNQTPEIVEDVVVKYCNKIWATRKSPNKMTAKMFHGGRCWLSDPDHPNYVAGVRATKMVYGVDPDLTREGGSIPVTLTLQEATGKNVMLLPMGASDDGAHSQNEKIDIRNYIEGTKLLGAYAYELGQL